MFILDTDHVSILQLQQGVEFERLATRLSAYTEDQFFVTIVSFHEEVAGWNRYISNARNSSAVVRAYERFEIILANFASGQVLPFSADAADVFDDMRSRRVRIGTMDLRIASITIANQMTLLTRNTVDFSKVPSLRIEDWLVADSDA